MNETEAYKWAEQALRPLNNSGCESHRYQQVADLVASAILEAFKRGRHLSGKSSGQREAPALLEGVDYNLEYVDAHTVRLTRCP